MPDSVNRFISNIIKKWGKTFVIDLILALITYSLMVTNQLVNQLDGLWHGSESVANGWELSIGRWLWRYIDKARFHISPDPLTSLLTIILFILATIIMLDIFEVKDMFCQVMISMLFLISVSVCNHLSFRFQSPTFGFGLFFAAAAALALVRVRKPVVGVLVSGLFVALANACYQAFTGVVCILMLLYIAFCIKNDSKSGKELLWFTLRSLIAGIYGVIVYYVILQIEFARYNTVMNEYNGASDYNITGIITNFPIRFLTAYHNYFEYFKNEYFRINIVPAFRYVYCFFVCILIVIACVRLDDIFHKGAGMAVAYVACILLIPVAANFCLIIAYNSFMSIQMTVPMAMSVPALACLCSDTRDLKYKIVRPVKFVMWSVMALLIYTQFFMVQYDQQSMYMGRQSCLTMADQIDSYLIKHDLLTPGYKYVFVGKASDNREFYVNDFFGTANEYAQFGNFVDDPGGARMSWQGLWWFERGIRMDFSDEEKWIEIFKDDAVKNMPVFPAEGSCVFYNDVVVIKVSQPQENA